MIHFAADIRVDESIRFPGRYYMNNVEGTISLLEATRAMGMATIVFSSTAAVCGKPQSVPVRGSSASTD